MGSTCSIIRLVKILLNHGVTAGVRGGGGGVGGGGESLVPSLSTPPPPPPSRPFLSHLASPPERLIKLLTVNRFRALNIDDLIHFIKTQTRYVISWVAWGRRGGGRTRRRRVGGQTGPFLLPPPSLRPPRLSAPYAPESYDT